MAQYKVPQDIEADDKLLGPFTFRQFVYLLITAALVGILIFLFQLFPVLAIIPLPFIALFGALALPIKKDQPMETYLAAIISYYLKPHTRTWTPGQRETTIQITAPKIVEDKKVRDISSEEATHRLSFLADIVDTQGQSVNAFNTSVMRDDLMAEAQSTADMFENNHFDTINIAMQKDSQNRHDELMKMMRSAIAENEAFSKVDVTPTIKPQPATPAPVPVSAPVSAPVQSAPAPAPQPAEQDRSTFKIPDILDSPVVVKPGPVPEPEPAPEPEVEPEPEPEVEAEPEDIEMIMPEPAVSEKNISQNNQKSDIIEPVEDFDNSAVASKTESNNERKDEGEVFVSLH